MSRLRILNVLRASLAAHVRVPPCWRWADGGIARFRCQHKLVIRECELEKFERSFENIIAGSRAFNRYDSPEAGAVGGEEERRSGREVWGWRSAGGGGEGKSCVGVRRWGGGGVLCGSCAGDIRLCVCVACIPGTCCECVLCVGVLCQRVC